MKPSKKDIEILQSQVKEYQKTRPKLNFFKGSEMGAYFGNVGKKGWQVRQSDEASRLNQIRESEVKDVLPPPLKTGLESMSVKPKPTLTETEKKRKVIYEEFSSRPKKMDEVEKGLEMMRDINDTNLPEDKKKEYIREVRKRFVTA